ncbi:MAG TPA: hypothetical protein VHB21_28170 [Minicystis sp.]|nr:hypothetical protein [Minicystis sp.]
MVPMPEGHSIPPVPLLELLLLELPPVLPDDEEVEPPPLPPLPVVSELPPQFTATPTAPTRASAP